MFSNSKIPPNPLKKGRAVPDRPGRSEARVRKRRPKAYPLMTKPRHELRNMKANCLNHKRFGFS